eukprot:51267-Prorocentrum_minimum.AAC.1
MSRERAAGGRPFRRPLSARSAPAQRPLGDELFSGATPWEHSRRFRFSARRRMLRMSSFERK